jgi:hypothetical protein
MMKTFLVAFLIGLIIGWSATFVDWYFRKRNLRWAWLLCKPLPLSETDRKELHSFYS